VQFIKVKNIHCGQNVVNTTDFIAFLHKTAQKKSHSK